MGRGARMRIGDSRIAARRIVQRQERRGVRNRSGVRKNVHNARGAHRIKPSGREEMSSASGRCGPIRA